MKQDVNLPLESYSPRSPCTINYGLKSRNEMHDHSIYILHSLGSKDLQRTLRKSSVGTVVSLSHAPKFSLSGFNGINPVKIVRKCLGTERFSPISRIPRAKRESEKFSGLSRNRPQGRKTNVNRLTWQILIHPVHILKYFNLPILPMYIYSFDYECG